MKYVQKITAVLLLLLLLASCTKETSIYNNTATTTTNLAITEQGMAVIDTRYMGYRDKTTGASIHIRVEEQAMEGEWLTVSEHTIHTDSYYHNEQYLCWVSHLGTYRATVEYLIFGADGSTDTIRAERAYTLSHGLICSEGENGELCLYEPIADCTTPGICERCKSIPQRLISEYHSPAGNPVMWDESYHYKACSHTTPFGDLCSYIEAFPHKMVGANCWYCPYRE